PVSKSTSAGTPGSPVSKSASAGTPGSPVSKSTSAGTPGSPVSKSTSAGTPGSPVSKSTSVGTPGSPVSKSTSAGTPGSPVSSGMPGSPVSKSTHIPGSPFSSSSTPGSPVSASTTGSPVSKSASTPGSPISTSSATTKEPNHPSDLSSLPVQKLRTKSLKFQPKWFRDFPWLHVDPNVEGILCHTCAVAAKQDLLKMAKYKEQTFISVGFKNWKKAIEKFQSHQKSDAHKTSNSNLINCNKTCGINTQLSKQLRQEQAVAQKALLKIVSATVSGPTGFGTARKRGLGRKLHGPFTPTFLT
ncbi:nascent polypeptide-associated complex subunit alpha, muscle-specific form-like, partial [Patiria miniata]|uniref:TTF-type domain-containing protein n=1 Tax=Patiria miniata TaxID=46514 RepID=A0A914AHN8_PATMI